MGFDIDLNSTKLNNQTTTADYVKRTNHKFQHLDATVQLLQKRTTFKTQDANRTPRPITYSNKEHNLLICNEVYGKRCRVTIPNTVAIIIILIIFMIMF